MDAMEQRRNAQKFVEYWQKAKGNEDSESRSFWIEFLEKVMGIPDATRVLEFERRIAGRKSDVFFPDQGVLIEMKSRGVSLDKSARRYEKDPSGRKRSSKKKKEIYETPYQQAKWYADNLPNSMRPTWIITSNFDEFRIYNLDDDIPGREYEQVKLEELPDQVRLFSFMTDHETSRLEREKQLSVQAGEIVANLYHELADQYHNIEDSPAEQRSLNILITRIVFLLYAEDAGILRYRDQFNRYLKNVRAEDFRDALIALFKVLDTPIDKRDPYLKRELAEFPYINGSLFSEEGIVIPQFTEKIKAKLLEDAALSFDWKGISPTIFGAVFESTLNPETRRAGGMHYTSIENIHKVIDPLFLDDLTEELQKIEGYDLTYTQRRMRFEQFQDKLASIKILDPACGSGNFLTESYLSLRRLENRVIETLQGDQVVMGFDRKVYNPVKVSIDQFFGIEINDFAVAVAKTALWIAEEQMLNETMEIVNTDIDFLPLTSNEHIKQANALQIDWNNFLPASQCTFIVGNPPFKGYSTLNAEQKRDRTQIFGRNGNSLDYVACWFKKAADYMENTTIHAAFVATNSIVQGQQVQLLWGPLFAKGIYITFAYQSFVWNNEATDQAHVHVVIVGFSYVKPRHPRIFIGNEVNEVKNINGYLKDAPNVFVGRRARPLCNATPMTAGGKPTDGGFLLLTPAERNRLLREEPKSERWIRPFSMGAEFINGKDRYCLWLVDITQEELESMPLVLERVEKVRDYRSQSSKAATRKKASTPWRFDEIRDPEGVYIGIPKVSSERRRYVPLGFITNGMIPGDKLFFIPTDSLYIFGVMMSQFHNAWMRAVAGRLKSDYSYANTIVYNNLIWPTPTDTQRKAIEKAAEDVLAVRDAYPDKSLAELYDPNKMPKALLRAHKELDRAVETAYGVDFDGDEEKIVAHLFKLYARATED